MSDNPTEAGAAIDQLKAERKRLATAKGLVTRERNKLARERETLQSLALELDEWQVDLQARESEFASTRRKLEEAEAELVMLHARLTKAEGKKAAKGGMRKLLKKLAKAERKVKKLQKTVRKYRKLFKAAHAAVAVGRADANVVAS